MGSCSSSCERLGAECHLRSLCIKAHERLRLIAPTTMPSPPTTVPHAYRHLLRGLLRSVQYSKPSRYIVLDRLRSAFRTNSANEFEPQKIARTLEFLDGATKTKGLEHRVLKNLCLVWYWRKRHPWAAGLKDNQPFKQIAYEQFDRSVEALNESMGLCIK